MGNNIEQKKKKVLDTDSINGWISGINGLEHPESLMRCIKHLETLEDWTFDQESSSFQKINTLASLLNDTSESTLERKLLIAPEQHSDFLKMLTYLNIGPALRALSLIHKRQPALTGDLLLACQTNAVGQATVEAKLFLDRIKILVKQECYLKIFSKERRTEIIEILKEINEEGKKE